jgi:NitT/TauT family transport system substrate-binding protein
MLMSDHGLGLYGNIIMAEPGFAKANPGLVKGFVKATVKGWQDAIKDPAGAIKALMKRNSIADEQVELDRLKMSIRDNVLTPWVKANGFGGVDMARLEKSIEQIAVTYDFTAKPKAADVFTAEYLAPKAERMLP